MHKFDFISGTGHDLMKKQLLTMDYGTTEGGTGHVGFICHKQPALEKAIRDVINGSEYPELRAQCTVQAVSEDEDQVYVDYDDANGDRRHIQARFLVGADGKTGFVRKRYLEPKGILMERCEG